LTRDQVIVVIVVILFFLLVNLTGPKFRDRGAVDRWFAEQDRGLVIEER
jgi:hypothetical protein